ncbi:hypothetical protein L9F63_021508 [Diploptera punctata]|uniref:DDB1- and CUL4-associated factor 13 n=1 Tax=Diploptera punctata TaxID=6984 RepID=A0AAD8EBF2_DIPPU|nr:hypothetical protein L9F63_021508 [Diploptera punctata]
MKIKVLTRNPDNYLRETKRDIHKVPRNYDPSLHPFEAVREYTRALNAVKLERVFAKPFIGNLDGHQDGVSCLGKHPSRLSLLVSGAYDGEVRMWDLPRQRCIRNFRAHDGYIRGITFEPEGNNFFTAGDDKTIKMWKTEPPEWGEEEEPINTYISRTVLMSISHHQTKPMFATCGEICQLWEEDRNEPIRTFQWGVDSLHEASFNPIESHLLATCASDRSIILYDTRDRTHYNLYTFDTRKLKEPLCVHMDHISAVTAVDYSPTGREFVSGSYDKSIRIFESGKHHSREVYHTKRMQRLACVMWSMDNKYVLCGSDEMNIRIWKAKAAEKLGALKPREKRAMNYSEALKQKFAGHPQVRRIARHRQVPKHIYHAQKELRTIRLKEKRKESNRRAHSKPGSVPFVSEKKKHIVEEQL